MVPKNVKFHFPTDLFGLSPATYEPKRGDGILTAALGPACNQIRNAIKDYSPAAKTESLPDPVDTADYDDRDIVAILVEWIRGLPDDIENRTIHYAEIDRQFNFPEGSAERLIETAAARWGYTVLIKGRRTIMFERQP